MGLGRFHHPRSSALSDLRANCGLDLQLVEPVHEAGDPEPTYGSDDHSAAVTARDRSSNQAWEPDDVDYYQQSREGGARSPGPGDGKQPITKTCEYCAALDVRTALEMAAEVHFSRLANKAIADASFLAVDCPIQLPDLGLEMLRYLEMLRCLATLVVDG